MKSHSGLFFSFTKKHPLFHPQLPSTCRLPLDMRCQGKPVFLKQQHDGRAGQLKMSHFSTSPDTAVFPVVDDPTHDQRSNGGLDHRAEMFRCEQCPDTAVQGIDRIGFTGQGLNAVELAGDIVVYTLIKYSL